MSCRRREGAGEPVVLVHGYLANGKNQWDTPGVIAALLKDSKFKLIVLDSRGHGKSDKPTDPNPYGEEMAKDVVRLMDNLGVKKPHVVGYSLGSFIVQKVAEMQPTRVHSLTVGGAGLLRPEEVQKVKGLAAFLGEPAAAALIKEKLGGTLPIPTDKKEIAALRAAGEGSGGLALKGSLGATYLGPALGIIGKKDEYFIDSMRALKTSFKALEGPVEIAGATHLSAFTTKEFHDALVAFLNANPGAN